MSLCFMSKGRLETYTVLLLGAKLIANDKIAVSSCSIIFSVVLEVSVKLAVVCEL